MKKTDFCKCKNKDADQLPCDRATDQSIDSTIPLLPISKISSILPSSVVAQTCLRQTWSETLKTCFLTKQL